MRRVGKIGRRKVFPKVKNVNVESLKNGSKLLDFWDGSLPQPLPKGKGFSNFDIRLYINSLINCPINSVQFVNNSCSQDRMYGLCSASCIVLRTLAVQGFGRLSVGFWTPQCRVLNARCVGFCVRFNVQFVYSLKHKLYISQHTENQRNVGFISGSMYSLYSFFVSPFIYVQCNDVLRSFKFQVKWRSKCLNRWSRFRVTSVVRTEELFSFCFICLPLLHIYLGFLNTFVPDKHSGFHFLLKCSLCG